MKPAAATKPPRICAFRPADDHVLRLRIRPLILRLYGSGSALPRGTPAYQDLLDTAFSDQEPLGARQIIRLDVDLVQTSCGYGVPLFDYKQPRPTMRRWAEAKGEDGLAAYWAEKNQRSIDGFPTRDSTRTARRSGLMDDDLLAVLCCLVGYLLGSIPFGLLLTKLAGLGDIRGIGSGNIGATNVLRTGHKGLAAATLLLDGLKGAAAVLIARACS